MRTSVLLPAGDSSMTLAVALRPGNILPGESKVFQVYLGPAPGAFVSPTAQANVTITDTDPDQLPLDPDPLPPDPDQPPLSKKKNVLVDVNMFGPVSGAFVPYAIILTPTLSAETY